MFIDPRTNTVWIVRRNTADASSVVVQTGGGKSIYWFPKEGRVSPYDGNAMEGIKTMEDFVKYAMEKMVHVKKKT